MKEKGFSKDFIMVVIGQIISLFGNAALRFALPLYLLNQTGSSALYGTVTACAFLPSIAMSPIGGIVADRVNKRNIMVALDFLTAAVVGGLAVCLRFGNEVLLIALTLMILYGIAGAYQPSVQAAIPVLVRQEKVMSATSIINTVSSLSSLTGPVLGGILYSMYGLVPVLILCTTCFFASAVMEIFIHIPYQKPEKHEHILRILKTDFAQGIHFAWKENRKIGEVVLIVCGINLFLSAMMIVGIPYLVTEVLELETELANQLCGFAEGALAAGGLAGGICAGIFAKRLKFSQAGNQIMAAAASAFPMAIILFLPVSAIVVYGVMMVCCFGIMMFATIFTVQMMSYVQIVTPRNLTGKVIALVLMVSTCSQPLGNAMYGILFELCRGADICRTVFRNCVICACGCDKKKLSEYWRQNIEIHKEKR